VGAGAPPPVERGERGVHARLRAGTWSVHVGAGARLQLDC